jgi:hypothetical protein
MKTLRTLTVVAALAMLTEPANAGFIMTINQTGSGLSFSGNGSINTTTFTLFTPNASSGALLDVQPNTAFVAVNIASNLDEYNMADSGPASFGPGSVTKIGPTSSVAGIFIFQQVLPAVGAMDLPAGYVSGTPLPAVSATWAGATYADLGITPGNYTWTWPTTGLTTDSFELVIVPTTATPEPSSLVLLGTAAAGAGFGGWIRRRRAYSAAA